METLANLNDNKTFAETEKKIRDFFTEDSIIERTGDCKTYFEKATIYQSPNLLIYHQIFN